MYMCIYFLFLFLFTQTGVTVSHARHTAQRARTAPREAAAWERAGTCTCVLSRRRSPRDGTLQSAQLAAQLALQYCSNQRARPTPRPCPC